jgi:CelD/BcsL family acetyltransferase involved in cellulose biosynthesis
MNFYASPGYLGAVAATYFSGRHTSVEDVRIGDALLRLLVVDGKHAITDSMFLDYHEPLAADEARTVRLTFGYAKSVVRSTIEIASWVPQASPGLDLAPYIDWSAFPTYGHYHEHVMARGRGLVRERERRGRRLAEHIGELVFTADDAGDDVFAFARRWKGQQLRETGLRDYFADPKTLTLLMSLQRQGLLTVSTLRGGGRIAAVWIGFIHGGVWSGWVFAFNPALRKYSAGHQLVRAMLEESFRRKHREFDFSVGAEEYKMLYATHGRVLGPLGRPPLPQRILARAKDVARVRAPALFDAARSLRRLLTSRITAHQGVQGASQ